MPDSTPACLSREELARIKASLAKANAIDEGANFRIEGPSDYVTFLGMARVYVTGLISHIEALSTRTRGMTEEKAREILAKEYERQQTKDAFIDWPKFVREGRSNGTITAAIAAIMQAASEVSGGNGAEEMRTAAAKQCEDVSSECSYEARKSNPYTEGFSDGADECASRIRALPLPPPSSGGVTEEEVRAARKRMNELNEYPTEHDMREALLAARKVRGKYEQH